MLAQNQKKNTANINRINHEQLQIEIYNLKNIWQTVFLDFRINRVPKQFSFNFKRRQTKHVINFILISQEESVKKVFYLLLTSNFRQKSVKVELAIIFLVQRPQIFSFIAFKQKIGLKVAQSVTFIAFKQKNGSKVAQSVTFIALKQKFGLKVAQSVDFKISSWCLEIF